MTIHNLKRQPQPPYEPHLVLVDDDPHSARLLMRMLLAHGAPSIHWVENPADVEANIGEAQPSLMIVDLKSSSSANSEFVAALRSRPAGADVAIAVMAATPTQPERESLLRAGADAVFVRHADIVAYRREAASIISYWVRQQSLEAIGA